MGLDAGLRQNLSAALEDGLDKQVLVGTNGLLTGTNLSDHDVSAVTTYALYVSDFAYGRVDGRWANDVMDLKVLFGAATYAHASTLYRGNQADQHALARLQADTGGVKVSAHVPAVASNQQNGVVRLGMRRDAVAPIWEGITMIPDEITKAKSGEIVITAVMLYAFKILRTGGFLQKAKSARVKNRKVNMPNFYVELRHEADSRILRGTAMPYGQVAKMPWGKERFEPGAFGDDVESLDVILNVQHERGQAIARTGGGGLVLEDSPEALRIRAELPNTREADDTLGQSKSGAFFGGLAWNLGQSVSGSREIPE